MSLRLPGLPRSPSTRSQGYVELKKPPGVIGVVVNEERMWKVLGNC